jgi:hypothetical protein
MNNPAMHGIGLHWPGILGRVRRGQENLERHERVAVDIVEEDVLFLRQVLVGPLAE